MIVRIMLALMLLSKMIMTTVIIQDFWTCKRIAFAIYVVWVCVMCVFAGIGILYVAGFYC